MKNLFKYILLVPLAGLTMYSCKNIEEQKTEKVYPVEIMEAGYIKLQNQYQYSGRVSSVDKTILSTKVMGQIEFLQEEGSQVKKGELLIGIRSKELSAQLISAQASQKRTEVTLLNTRKQFDRITRLLEKGSATQREIDDISTQVQVQEAQLISAKQRIQELEELISYTRITSPIDGFVSEKFINLSDMASPAQPLLAIESKDKLEIRISVPEFEIGHISEGMTINVEVPSLNVPSFDTRIASVIPSSEFSGSQFIAMADLPAGTDFKPGMFVRVNLSTGQNQKILVPWEVIHKRGQLTGIYTINQQGESMLRWVRLGKTYPEGVEVLSGLKQGEQIITTFGERPENGVKVEIKNSKES